jgi:DNA-binding PucR family transcriptional regulator
VAAAYREAGQTLRALLALGREGDVADGAGTGVARLLLGASGPAEAEEFVQAVIGPLLAHDDARGTDLVATVEAWFDAQGSATRAGRALHVHTNTVIQRLERVDALLGPDWREPGRGLDVRLALRVWRLRGVQT